MKMNNSESIEKKNSCDAGICKRTSIGGQALIEGVMMNGPHKTAMAVRNNKGEIIVEEVTKPNLKEKCPLFKLPIIRGIIAYIESMMIGYKTLMRSADLSGMTELEDEDDNKSVESEADVSSENEARKENDDEKKSNKLSETFMTALMIFSSIIGIALAVFLFMYIPSLIYDFFDSMSSKVLTSMNLRGLIEGIMKLMIFIGYISLVSLTKDIKRLFQYHGAEHKTIFCYEKGLELTVENVKMQKRFHPRCGTSFLFLMIAVGILLSTLVAIFFPIVTNVRIVWVFVKILLIPIFCGVGYELLKICGKYDNLATKIIAAPGLLIQRITTKEPDDSMMEVAIMSMKEVIPENPNDDKIG